MISKIFFLAALILIVCWIILFLIFDTIAAIHIIAILGIICLVVSHVTKNDDN